MKLTASLWHYVWYRGGGFFGHEYDQNPHDPFGIKRKVILKR